MSEAIQLAHTPEKWIAVNGPAPGHPWAVGWNVYDENRERIATVTDGEDAHLIAASPETAAERDRLRAVNADLLAALEEWARLNNIKGLDPAVRRQMKSYAAGLTTEALHKARAAIARAKGDAA